MKKNTYALASVRAYVYHKGSSELDIDIIRTIDDAVDEIEESIY